jgi:hypothetical protein
MSNQEDLQ